MVQIDQAAIGHILKNSTEEKQILKCIEELSELQKELCRYLEGDITTSVFEEMADVLITVEQMKVIFCISDEELNGMISYKLGRTLARLRNRKKEETE